MEILTEEHCKEVGIDIDYFLIVVGLKVNVGGDVKST